MLSSIKSRSIDGCRRSRIHKNTTVHISCVWVSFSLVRSLFVFVNVWYTRTPNACTNVIRMQSWTLNTSTQLKSLMDGVLYIAEQSTVHTCSQPFSLTFHLIHFGCIYTRIQTDAHLHRPFRMVRCLAKARTFHYNPHPNEVYAHRTATATD